MPFQKVDKLPPHPAVKVFFSGQLILEPSADGKTCEVFINRSAPDHHLSVEVRRKRPYKPDVIVMRHHGPLTFADEADEADSAPRKHGLLIRMANTAPQGVKAFDGGIPSTGCAPLSRALNLKSIHTVDVGQVDTLGGRPSVLLDDGVFYTADLTPDDLGAKLKKKKTGSEPKPLDPFASIIGVYIDLPAQASDAAPAPAVNLTWRLSGKLTTLPLKRLPGEGSLYEIYICNDPFFEDDAFDSPPHKEFEEYYKILPGVHQDEQFEMMLPDPDAEDPDGDRGSTRTPCMPVLKNE
jgi:hypothetical protein